jgi:hypothetical protein
VDCVEELGKRAAREMQALRVNSGLRRSLPSPIDCNGQTLQGHPLCRIRSAFFLKAVHGLENCDRRENSRFSTQSAASGHSRFNSRQPELGAARQKERPLAVASPNVE